MIRLFVFDLGNVILPFQHRQIAYKLYETSTINHSTSPEEIFKYLFDIRAGIVNSYEEGRVSTDEFFNIIKARYQLSITIDEFKGIWNPIFEEDQRVNDAIVYLKSKGYPCFLLSNTNELHFSYIINRYPIVHLLDEWILSFEVGVKKPDRRIYEAIFERMDVSPDEVFYVDDIADYVAAAARLGIRGMVFKDADSLWKTLKEHSI